MSKTKKQSAYMMKCYGHYLIYHLILSTFAFWVLVNVVKADVRRAPPLGLRTPAQQKVILERECRLSPTRCSPRSCPRRSATGCTWSASAAFTATASS